MRGVALFATVLVALLASPFIGVAADADGPEGDAATQETTQEDEVSVDQSVGTVTSNLQWTSTTSGDLGIKLTLGFTTAEQCGFRLASGGWIGARPVWQYSGYDRAGRGWTVANDEAALGAHGASVRVELGTDPYDLRFVESLHGFGAAGQVEWLFAGFDLVAYPNQWTNGKSIVFDLQCTGDFTIERIQAGRNVIGFAPSRAAGGAGATAFGTTVDAGDGLGGHFSDPEVAFRFRADPYFQTGALRRTGPDGGGFHFLSGESEIFADGPGGLYNAQFVRAANENPDGLGNAVALYAGLSDVQSLDEAAGT